MGERFYKIVTSTLLMFFCLFLLLIQGCQTPPNPKYIKDGKPYGVVKGLFRVRWWNFYERGVSFSEGGFWDEAIADFQEAMKQRDKDQRRARTYGMHFIDYFPHRDLGVAYYHLGDYEKSLKELEYSLASVDTAKAKFYLNKVRQAIIKDTATDREPPTIKISAPEEGTSTNKFSVTVEGEVEDDTYAYSIEINHSPLFLELASKKIPFSQEIKLERGVNEIKVAAKDLTGKTTEHTITIVADFVGPSINITNYASGDVVGEEKIILVGSLFDDTGITTLSINQTSIGHHQEKEISFSYPIVLKEGENQILLSASDIAGNETKGEFFLTYQPGQTGERKKTVSPHPVMIADLNLGILDTGGNRLFSKRINSDTMPSPLKIALKDLTESQTVYYDTIFIDGSASGSNVIVRIEINGEPLPIRAGKNIFFSYLAGLKKGENPFTIKAVDNQGSEATKNITIIREVPKVLDIGSRLAIAILPFAHKGELSPAGEIIDDGLIESFSNLNRFSMITRGTELEAVLKELKLSQTDLVDKSKALQVGKLVAAEAVLSGSVIETTKDIEIIARLINTETSSIMATKDVYGQDKSLSHLHFLLNGLALKFKHDFPMVEGLVVKVQGKELVIDLGKNRNLKKEMKLIIYREGEKIVHPVTGKVMGSDCQILGEAMLDQVFDDFSKGKILVADELSEVKEKDRVITK